MQQPRESHMHTHDIALELYRRLLCLLLPIPDGQLQPSVCLNWLEMVFLEILATKCIKSGHICLFWGPNIQIVKTAISFSTNYNSCETNIY